MFLHIQCNAVTKKHRCANQRNTLAQLLILKILLQVGKVGHE